MNSKFGKLWGGWCSNDPLGFYGEGLWKNIRRSWGMFFSHTRLEVGDGSKIRPLHDLWCRDKALTETFPELYSITCMKDASVVVHLELSSCSH